MPWLELKSPNSPRRVIEIGKAGATLGRARDNTIPLDDVKSSSHHAAIVFVSAGKDAEKEPERWIVSDAGSKNGTFVDSRRLERGEEIDLGTQTKIKIGKSVMRFHFEKPPESIAATDEVDEDDSGEVVAVTPAAKSDGGKNGNGGNGQSEKKPAAKKPASVDKPASGDKPASAAKPAAATAAAAAPAAVASAEAAAPAAEPAAALPPSAEETIPAPLPPSTPVAAGAPVPAAPDAPAPAAPTAEPPVADAVAAAPPGSAATAAAAAAPAAQVAPAATVAPTVAGEPPPAGIRPAGRTAQAAVARRGVLWREHAVTAGITGIVAIIAFAFGHVSNGASDQQRDRLDSIADNISKTAQLPDEVRKVNDRLVGMDTQVRDLDGELKAIDSDLRTLGTDLATVAALARETQRAQADSAVRLSEIAPILQDMLSAMATLQTTSDEQRDTIAALRARLDALDARPVQPNPNSNATNSSSNNSSSNNRPANNNAAGNNGNSTQETVVVPEGWHSLYGRGVPPAAVWIMVIEGSSSMTDPLDPSIDPRDQLGRRTPGNLPGDTRWESRFNRAVDDARRMVAFAQGTEEAKASIVLGSSAAKYMLDERVLALDSRTVQRKLEEGFPLLFALGSFSLLNSLQAAAEGGDGCVPRRGATTINLIVMSDEEDVDAHVGDFRDLARKLKIAGEGGHELHAYWVSYRPTEPKGLTAMKAAVTELHGVIADHKPRQ